MIKSQYSIDSLAKKLMKVARPLFFPGWCNNCMKPSVFVIKADNLREDVFCIMCRSFNRQRQLRYILDQEVKSYTRAINEITIWNTENSHSLHKRLSTKFSGKYVSSEFFKNNLSSGSYVNGVRHEDICQSSFSSSYFDFVLSSDVLEHVANPLRAFNELNRVLKIGGKHVFTVPFMENTPCSDIRAKLRDEGTIEYLKEPMFHGDPMRENGILVYTIFGEDLRDICQDSGFNLQVKKFSKPFYGIIGKGIVFVAEKQRSPGKML